MNDIEKSIMATLAYFDIFDHPLTLMEIWQWLYISQPPVGSNQLSEINSKKASLVEVQSLLDSSDLLEQKIDFKFGFYFLKGRQEIIGTRMKRYSLAERKFYKAKRIIKWLRHLPFIKMIAVCNTLAYNNSRREADIDLFIITERNRVWQTRFWVAGLLQLFNLRPSQGDTQDKICASFFVDEDSLNLSKLAINNDIYLRYWIKQAVPVYDDGIYKGFIQANEWVRQSLPNSLSVTPSIRRQVSPAGWLKFLLSSAAGLMPESIFKKYEQKIMRPKLRQMANKDSRVVVTDCILKFHDNDRREMFLDKWRTKLNLINGQ